MGGQTIPAGGGAIRVLIPAQTYGANGVNSGYVIYGYQGPQASYAGLQDAITIQQNGQTVPSMTVYRQDGPNGDPQFNPIYPYERRGRVDQTGHVIGGQNFSNLTYSIDIPVVTNNAPMTITLRTDASAGNMLVKLDGGVDLNSQMGLGYSWTNPASGFVDRRDCRPGYTNDMFVGYEQAAFQFRYGPEKFAAANIARNIVVSLGAETYSYTVGGPGSVFSQGNGTNTNTSTANWLFHDPSTTTDVANTSMLTPTNTPAGQVETIWVKVGYAAPAYPYAGNIYYTTYDGGPVTNFPEASFGVPKAGSFTQVAPLSFDHNSSDGGGTYDWWKGTITNPASGPVFYKIGMYEKGIPQISDGDQSKYYGLTQFAITNFNPQTAQVWLHNDLNTNFTSVGLAAGFHMLRLRAFLPRAGKSSVFNTFMQTFFYDGPQSQGLYDTQAVQGVVAFPAHDGDTIGGSSYGVVVRTDPSVTEVDYNITDNETNNDDGLTGQINGNGNGSNGVPSWAVATQESPDPTIGAAYPGLPEQFRFNYVSIASNGTATINVRLKQAVNSTFTNVYTTLTRVVNCSGNAESLVIAFPTQGQQIDLGQSTPYTNVFCACGLSQNLANYTLSIDGVVQPRSSIFFQGNFCNCYNGTPDLRFGWSGMSPGTHTIQISYDDGLVKEFYSNIVTVQIAGVYASVISPPPADPVTGASPETILVNTCTGGAPQTRTNYTVVVNTTNSVNSVQVSFSPSTNIFAGGSAIRNTNFTGSVTNDTFGLYQWTFPWTNVIAGTWTVQVTAAATGIGSNLVSQPVIFSFRQLDLAGGTNTDDSDNDGISDSLETNNVALPSGDPGLWKNSDVHVAFFSGKTNPLMADTDGDGLPDGLELGIGTVPAAADTVRGLDPYCGSTNFMPDLDPPLYNTTDNSSAPAGYDGYTTWPYNINNSHSDQIAGTVTDPNNPDTDGDGLMDGVEDINHNGRVDITLTNSAGMPLTSTNGVAGLTYLAGSSIVVIAHPPTIYNTSIIDRAQVLRVWPNALWLETDPNNPDSDGDGIPDGQENASHTGYMAIGLLNHNIGYNAGSCGAFAATNCVMIVTNAESPNASCGCVTNILPIPLPSSILYAPGTSRVNRKALIQQFPNAVLLETDPMDAHTDGDPNGLSDGWKTQYGLDPWDDGVIGHTNWHTGALITTTRNGSNGNPSGDGISNAIKYENGLNPNDYYTSNVPAVNESIPLNDGPNIGTTAGVTWQQEFEAWSVDDLKVVRPYDGIGPNYQGQTVFPGYDGYDYSRDIIAFYAHDGGATNEGGDGNYYFRIDLHDLSPSAETSGHVSFYVLINVGLPGTGQTTIPEGIGATSDMGWHVLVGVYGDTFSGSPTALVYTAVSGTNNVIGFGQPGGVQTLPHWRGDLSSVSFAIPRQTLINQGWSGITPLSLQVFDTDGPNLLSYGGVNEPTKITDSVYDNSISQSEGNTYGTALHYWFTTVNQNAINLSAYEANTSILSQTNRPHIAKVAIVLDANQSLIPATSIQGLVSNAVTRTPTGLDPTYDPGNNPIGYYRALESAQVFGVPLNLHLNGALISALQWAHSNPALDPSGSRDGAQFNQRIASMIANGQASLVSGMYGSHMAPYFTGSVNQAGIQLQDDIMRTVYGNNSISANTPVFLPERAADGPTLTDLAANSGHNFTILDQTTHLWWWADEVEGGYSDQPAATGDNGYTINTFNGMKAFLISDLYSDLIYSNSNLGAYDTLREVLIQKALDSNYGQIVVLEDQWENAGGLSGNTANPDLLNLTIRWLANHQWIKVVRLDQFGSGQYDINNDGVTNGADIPSPVTISNTNVNYSIEANDFILHSCATNLNNWYYGNSQFESFYNRHPILRGDDSNTLVRVNGNESYANTNTDVFGGKMLGTVQAGGTNTILHDTWADVQTVLNNPQSSSQTNLNKLAQLVYLSGLFETGFHDVNNYNDIRYSTGNYIYPETATDMLSQFALKGAARATRQADIVAYAALWAASNPSSNTVTAVFDAEQTGDAQHNYVISNNRVYAVFERIGGRLVAAFGRDPNTGSAYEIIGNLASTPEYESEREGMVDGTGSGPLAYRASGFKDWYAVTNSSGAGVTQYVNDYYNVASAPSGTGWQFTSQDGKISKTITLATGAAKLEAQYVLSGGVRALYIRHGLSPDVLNLLYQGQANLHGPITNVAGQVSLQNISPTCVAMGAVDYADTAAHSNTQYNATADDTNGVGGVQWPMRDLAQTAQVQVLGSNSFSFALDLEALQGDAAPNGDGISNYQAAQLGANPFSPWDTNGLTAAWELKYFGKTGLNASTNTDGSGMSYYQDFIAGLDPTNPNSLFRVVSVVPVFNGYQISWASVPGKNYQVQAATNLSSANYTAVSGTITASGTITTFVDIVAPSTPRFYRIQVTSMPPPH